jgi:hypothetical protein
VARFINFIKNPIVVNAYIQRGHAFSTAHIKGAKAQRVFTPMAATDEVMGIIAKYTGEKYTNYHMSVVINGVQLTAHNSSILKGVIYNYFHDRMKLK